MVVGVNRFVDDGAGDGSIEVFRVDPEVERLQIERLRQVRASRSEADWRAALAGLTVAAKSGGNLVPPIVSAVEAFATIGEISDALREVFGEFTETATV